MTDSINNRKLRIAFYKVQKLAKKMSEAQAEFNSALTDYYPDFRELPDDMVDVCDYGTSSATYTKFKQRMKEFMEDGV